MKNGKHYVGSAYGGAGIWSRLCCYVGNGHGGNDGLVELLQSNTIEYAVANFRFALLEVLNFNTPDDVIIGRESHWKNVLLSRQFGYNRN